jgi:RNA polymerase primary sigma factor
MSEFRHDRRPRLRLSHEDEIALVKRYQRGDHAAFAVLCSAHEPFLYKTAKHYARAFGVDVESALQGARYGLARAAQKWSDTKGAKNRFLTYAGWQIRAKAKRECQDEAGCLRVPVWKQDKAQQTGESAIVRGIPMDAEWGGEFGPTTLHDTLIDDGEMPDDTASAAEEQRRKKMDVDRAIVRLNERAQCIIRRHTMLHPTERGFLTLQAVGDKYGISRERVRQLEMEAKADIAAYLATIRKIDVRDRKARRRLAEAQAMERCRPCRRMEQMALFAA